MEAKVSKSIQQPDCEQQISFCMKMWPKRTTGRLQPREGTFLAACCDKANIKHHKVCDTSNSRLGKRARDREVLRWFRQGGRRKLLNVTSKESKTRESESSRDTHSQVQSSGR